MNVPSGYTALDMVGFTDKGPYNSATAYVKNDIAHYGGNLWRCLVDDTTNVTPTEGANWTVFLAEPTSAAEDIIAPVEASAVSTRQYAVGKQLILNDTLYRVTAAVNIGDTLAVGTNITASDTVVEQLATKANTSSLATVATSGSYADLSNKPTLGTAAAKDVPASGNASTTEVVMGDDTRLSDARNAADVYSWAKASTKPTYNGSEINTSDAQTGTAQSAVAATIASGTSMDAAVKDLLDNDVTLSSQISSVNEALSNEVSARATLGAHNIAPFKYKSWVYDNVTWTANKTNKSISVSGTPSTGSYIQSAFTVDEIPPEVYTFSGISGTSNIKAILYLVNDGTTVLGQRMYEEQSYDISSYIYDSGYIVLESIANNVACSGTIYPMLRLASDANSTYTPYAMTNRELTEAVDVVDVTSEFSIGSGLNVKAYKFGRMIQIIGETPKYEGTTIDLVTIPNKYAPINRTTNTIGSVYYPSSTDYAKKVQVFVPYNSQVLRFEASDNTTYGFYFNIMWMF